MQAIKPQYIPRSELAELLEVSVVTIKRWTKSGKLPQPLVIQRSILYSIAKLHDFSPSKPLKSSIRAKIASINNHII